MRRQRWRQKWRPIGGWQLLLAVLGSSVLLGMAATVVYYYAVQPAQVKVITPPAQVIHTTIRPPVLPARTHYVTEPPVTVQPSYQPTARPQGTPSPSLTPNRVPSSGSANIPGISGYVPPSATGGDASPSTDNPIPGVTSPASPSSPSQGGGF